MNQFYRFYFTVHIQDNYVSFLLLCCWFVSSFVVVANATSLVMVRNPSWDYNSCNIMAKM